MYHGGSDAGSTSFQEGITVHEQHEDGKEKVNEGVSQW